MENEIISSIPVTLYSELEKYNEVISKGRCRLFYKDDNRNGTWITEEFANKLLKTIAYAPVKGIYDFDEGDYTDHGKKRNLGRIYGVVPSEPNLAWEKHLDTDGVEREYACVDVLYYTGLYKEASEIAGKAQSMELYGPSIKGEWKVLNGKKYYVYDDACFLGLQVLGDQVEPCFEGAAFYNLCESMKEFMDAIDKYNNKSGGQTMPTCLFKLSDNQKANALWDLLNSETDENGYKIYAYSVMDVYDDYAIAFNYTLNQYERVYYTKNDETDSIEINEKKKCYILDVTEEEKDILEAMRKKCGSYSKIEESYTALENQNSELSTKNVELNNSIATLNTEKDKLSAQLTKANENYTVATANIQTLTEERDNLLIYKKNVEDNAKLAIIETYAAFLSEDILDKYKNNLDNYNTEELDMRLTYEQKQANPSTFSKIVVPTYIPKDDGLSGIESILSKYEKK